MVSIAGRRMPSVRLILMPALMQGAGSAESVIEALRTVDSIPDVDVVVLGRGGGSLEDLWTFNEESVARAVFACHVPVVSAVGHETDFTLADFVSDLRAPTPSAAMELVIPDREELADRIEGLLASMKSSIASAISGRRSGLESLMNSRSMIHPERMLQDRWQMLDIIEARLVSSLKSNLSRAETRLGEASARLQSLSPLSVLSRGYGVIRDAEDGRLVKSICAVKPGAGIDVLISDGTLMCEVMNTREGWKENE
jgi:exodeoxyribonuclease VII large subunit